MRNIVKDIWNSEAFMKGAEVNYKILCSIGTALKYTAEAILEIIEAPCTGEQPQVCRGETSHYWNEDKDVEQATYEYWSNLSEVDQQYYFEHNETLQSYGENYRYNDREQMAKSAAYIAKCTRRAFTDKYDIY